MINGFNGKYRFLSNFYASPIEFEGITYPTVEHAYQAAKTTSEDVRQAIASMSNASQAKSFGRSVVLRDDWDDIKISVMRTLIRKKFYDPDLKQSLLLTNEESLCEVNYWHDNFWGSCSCKGCGNEGQNWLGRLLMEQRTAFKVVA